MHYGPIMMDLEGTTISSKEKLLLQHPGVGGVILFTRNYAGLKALAALVEEIRSIANKKPLLIAVDHEGGRVWRFKEGFTQLPPARHYGEVYKKDPKEALKLAHDAGWVMAAELLEVGIDISLAPVLDLVKGVSAVIGDRGFHSDPGMVTKLAGAFIEGMNQVGMSATGKHFPGHGGCAPDTHFNPAIDERTLQQLLAEDLLPFINLSKMLGGVMPAHVLYPAVDSVPAGFSKTWLQTILREKLNFQGAIISDCLSMKGAAIGGDFVVRTRLALDAGCDMVILCLQERDLMQWLLDKLERSSSEASHKRLSALAGKFQNTARKAPKPSLAVLS